MRSQHGWPQGRVVKLKGPKAWISVCFTVGGWYRHSGRRKQEEDRNEGSDRPNALQCGGSLRIPLAIPRLSPTWQQLEIERLHSTLNTGGQACLSPQAPQTLRHSAASHFLHAGVDIVTISRWMCNANLATNSIYAEVDLESKRHAVQAAKPLLSPDAGCAPWRTQADIRRWLESL